MNPSDLAKMKETLDRFLSKENSSLDKYNLLTKKAYLTIGKPEPQAGEFAKTLQNMLDSLEQTAGWKICYKLK